ncbi:DUF4145 domain-containing protein [Pontibacter sp. JAM-7]|uniref:DUF4145 domain-containing protein n=1 Tax=Pontibacter sp. JAM-7 TaxID=3366581 RepID=UPI003AF778FD
MNVEKLNDVDFVTQIESSLGESYSEAKLFVNVAPIQSLVQLRSILTKTYRLIASAAGIELIESTANQQSRFSQHDYISQLKASNSISQDIISRLLEIKHAGNQAAHQESYELTADEYIDLAHKSFVGFCELLKLIRASLFGKFDLDFYFEAETTSQLKDLAFDALFKNDIDAKYRLGIALCEYHAERNEEKAQAAEPGDFVFFNRESFLLSADLIEAAAKHRHPDAMYEFAHLNLIGGVREKNHDLALDYLSFAAEKGHTMAKAHVGKELLFSEYNPDERDISFALEHLNEAASLGDPLALSTLSDVYKDGKYLEADPQLAYEYLLQSARSDFPTAQVKLSLHCCNERKYDDAIFWLDRASDAGVIEASLFKAKLLTELKPKSHEDVMKVVSLYKEYTDKKPTSENFYEFGSFLIDWAKDDVSLLTQAFQHLMVSYLAPGCSQELSAIIRSKAKRLIKRLERKAAKDYSVYSQVWLNNGVAELLVFFKPDGTLKARDAAFNEVERTPHMDKQDYSNAYFIPRKPKA